MSSEILFTDKLDTLSCQVPDCDHSSHGGDELFLHQGCHTGQGVMMHINDKVVLELRCAQCNRFVANIAVKNKIKLKNTCHPGEPVYVSYIEGGLLIYCTECDKVVERVDVYSVQEYRDMIDAKG